MFSMLALDGNVLADEAPLKNPSETSYRHWCFKGELQPLLAPFPIA